MLTLLGPGRTDDMSVGDMLVFEVVSDALIC